MCGENLTAISPIPENPGSPPRVRRKCYQIELCRHESQVHLRVCGENLNLKPRREAMSRFTSRVGEIVRSTCAARKVVSPPRVRRKFEQRKSKRISSVHLRVCGENEVWKSIVQGAIRFTSACARKFLREFNL